ncbi:MAG TPA: P-II family nitrogen regulator [Pyrinomonadaceae bacterium]|nr:P-II family nitrogen regulator [Pyrinomonadaceae bacterium]
MKLIKAYIRTNMIDKVIRALEDAGFTDMTVIDVKAIRSGIDPKDLEYSVEIAERYMNVAKLELVLEDDSVASAREVILKTARTGRQGDGFVYVSPVDEAIHIRTGKTSS